MNNKTAYIFFTFLILILFFDLGNLDGLRQGTEGFYLLISQEMFEASEFLTPRIYGEIHWSKPPLQFYYPMPLFAVFGGSYLLSARISILIFSLFTCFLISQWYEENLKRNWHECFAFLLLGFYFLKYSRIFMMEASLCFLTTLGLLKAYSFLKANNQKGLISSSLYAGASVLIKGPVSLAMIYPPLFIYSFLMKKSFKKLTLFYVLSFLIGSIWFLISYNRYGQEFFHYFFIRENLGKFNAKNYPITSVIQGLLIYSLPTILFLIPIIKEKKTKIFKNEFSIFAAISFCFFYFLWFLPKQKSHHYAVPAIPILSIFISFHFFELRDSIKRKVFSIANIVGSVFIAFSILTIGIIYFFRDSLAIDENSHYFAGCFFLLGFWTYSKRIKLFSFSILRLIIPQVLLWVFILPLGVLPAVPGRVIDEVQSRQYSVFVSYRKPFFIKEAMQREINFLPLDGLKSDEIKNGDVVFMSEKDFIASPQRQEFKTLFRWKVWKRGSRANAILDAIKNRDLGSLQEYYTLVQKAL